MAVELRTLRVTSDFDAGRYVAGMNQKVAADRAGTESSRAAGQAVDGLTIKVSSAVPLLERLSRTYVDGYGNAAKFNSELVRLARSQDTSVASVEHLELIYTGLQKRFGLVADAAELTKRGYTGLASAIENVNSRLSQSTVAESATAMSARIEQLRQQFDPTYVSAQRLSGELNDLAEAERLGVQITGGYERALEAIVTKHDAVAAAAKRQREEYARLAQEAREAQAADRAQSAFNQRLGVGSANDNSAAQSAAVFTRQFEIARMRADQEAQNFAADLSRRFSTGTGTSARDSAAVFAQQFAQQEELDRLRRQQQGSAFSSDLNDRLGINGYGTSARASASVFEESAQAAEQLERQVAAVRAQIDPLSAAQSRLNAELAEYQSLADRGAISTEELGRAQLVARQRYDAYSTELNRQKKGGVSGLPSYQLTNLLYQGTDVAQSLALGMPLSQVALQQGPQIAQIFAADSTAIKSLVSSTGAATLAIAGTVAVLGTAAKAWNDYIVSVKAVDTAASGLGRAVAGTREQLEASAQAGAATAGISIKAARDMEVQFLRTGKIGSENFERLIGISKNFGVTIGQDTAKAGETLAQMFANPASAADALSRQYGLIDAKTAEYASNLAAQNRLTEAQSALLDALPNRLAKAAEATTALGRAWQNVGTFAGWAYDKLGQAVDKAIYGPSLEEQIAAAQKAQDQIKNNPISSIFGLLTPLGFQNASEATQLEKLQEEKRRRDEKDARDRENARLSNAGVAAVGVADQSPAVGNLMQIQTLQNQIATLEAQRAGTSVEQEERINAALAAKKTLLEALLSRQTRLTEIEKLDIAASNERNPILRAELIQRRTRIELSLQEVSATEANAAAQRAYTMAMEEFLAGNRSQIADMQSELAIRLRLDQQVATGTITRGEAQSKLQEELALRPLVLAYDTAEGERKAELKEILDDLRRSYAGLAEEQRQASATDYIKSQTDALERLRAQQAVVGETPAVQAQSLARFDAERKIRDLGIDAAGKQAAAIREVASAIVDQNLALDRSKDAWDTYRNAGTSAIDTVIDGIVNGENPIDVLNSVLKDVTKTVLELGVANPLKNGLFGTNLGTFSDLTKGGSGALGGLFGDRGVGAMNVTAGTVVINGTGGAGILGSLGGAANDNGIGGVSGNALSALKSPAISSAGGAVDKAFKLLGANEGSDAASINSFLKAGGVDLNAAQSAWCAAFVNSSLEQVGIKGSGSQVATSFLDWGQKIDPSQILRGDVLVQDRGLNAGQQGGHVGFATGATRFSNGQQQLEMLSGNSNDRVQTEWVNAMDVQARRAADAAKSLGGLSATSSQATQGLGNLGPAVNTTAQGLNNLGGGLGQFSQQLMAAASGTNNPSGGLLGGLGSLFGGVSPTSPFWAPNTSLGSFLVRGYANGTDSAPGGVAMVGENGRELVNLPRGAQVVPNKVTEGLLASRSAANLNVKFNVINNNGSKVRAERRDTNDGPQFDVIIDEVVASKLNTPGSSSRRAAKSQFGLSEGLARR
ncbi:phage tail length tape measure family protein [Rhizobium laguerreae]